MEKIKVNGRDFVCVEKDIQNIEIDGEKLEVESFDFRALESKNGKKKR